MRWYGRIGALAAAVAVFVFWFSADEIRDRFVIDGTRLAFDLGVSCLQLLIVYWFGLQYDKMRYWAHHDLGTGVYNRRYIMRALPYYLAQGNAERKNVALYMIDADNLKAVNDSEGHLAGDRELRALARLLSRLAGKQDMVGRLGGDEFILIQQASSPEIAQRTKAALYDALTSHGRRLRASVGYALYPVEADTERQLLKLADDRMYEEKRRHRAQRYIDPQETASFADGAPLPIRDPAGDSGDTP